MDERIELLVIDYKAGRYTRRQFVNRALGLGLVAAALPALFEMAGVKPLAATVPAAEAAPARRTLIIGIAQQTNRPDPPRVIEYGDIIPVNNNIYEGIVRTKTGTTTVEPCLAKSWDLSPDGLAYTFHLRRALFHDGSPVTAAAIKLTFDRQTDTKNPYYFPGESYTETVFGNIAKVDALNPETVRITQSRPDVALLSNMALVVEGIVSSAALKKYGKDFIMHPVGSGPYMFDRWEKGVQFVETAFGKYWEGRPWVDRVIFRTVEDNTVRLQQLRRGELDIMNDVDFKDVAALQADKRFRVITGNFLQNQYIMLNGHKPPFDKTEVRQAIHFAVNKGNIGKVIFFGNFLVGAGPLMPGLPGYDAGLANMYPYDPTRAKALLQKAGIAEGSPVTLTHRTVSFWPEEAQLVQSDLNAVGLKVTLQGLDDATFFGQLNASQHQMALNDWTNDTGDPSNGMVVQFSSKRADQRMGWRNAEVDKLNADAQVERDPSKRAELYKKAQRLILEDAHYVVVGYPKTAMGAKANIQGLQLSPLRDVVIRGVTIA